MKELDWGWAATLLCALGASCGAPAANPTDIPLQASSVRLHESGALKKGYLKSDYVWPSAAAWPLQRWVHLYPDGQLRGGQLARAHPFGEVTWPASTFLWFDEQGRLESVWLAEPTRIDGVLCGGGPGSKVATGFYPSGALRSTFLRGDQEIQGIPCAASLMEPVRFLPGGELQSARLSRDFESGTRVWKRGERWERKASE